MAEVREEKPRTFTDYVRLVEQLQRNRACPLWYRGAGALFELLPSLYRHSSKTSVIDLARLESQLTTRFRQRSIPLHSRSLADDLEALFLMQHYGVPTRLLDWTENPFIGLYFAVMSAPCTQQVGGQPRFSEDAAVWILDPVGWNRDSLRHQSYDGEALTPGDDSLKGFKPSASFAGMNKHPVALYGASMPAGGERQTLPCPAKHRRPDWRNSNPKGLLPQLQTKVPTIRTWCKKMAAKKMGSEDKASTWGRT
jgi:hypothetical protein